MPASARPDRDTGTSPSSPGPDPALVSSTLPRQMPGDDAEGTLPRGTNRAGMSPGPVSCRRAPLDGIMTMQDRCDEASKTTWTRVGELDDIPRLGCRVVQTRHTDVAVFRTADDRIFALLDRCPHKQGKLSQGIVHGTSVTCPLHNWVIGLDDGLAKDPDSGCVHTVPARLEGTDILLALGS